MTSLRRSRPAGDLRGTAESDPKHPNRKLPHASDFPAARLGAGRFLGSVGLERLALVGVLETESLGRLGRARVSEVMDLTRHLDVRLARLERLRPLSIRFIDDRAFNHIHKSRRRV